MLNFGLIRLIGKGIKLKTALCSPLWTKKYTLPYEKKHLIIKFIPVLKQNYKQIIQSKIFFAVSLLNFEQMI